MERAHSSQTSQAVALLRAFKAAALPGDGLRPRMWSGSKRPKCHREGRGRAGEHDTASQRKRGRKATGTAGIGLGRGAG